jgi:DNA-binding NtrC family response regulator
VPDKSPVHRVLVIDDEPLIRWWLVESLGERGYAVTEAGDACAAVRTMSDPGAEFDTVRLDFRLPDSNDLTLLTRLRSLAPQARFILMTAYGSRTMDRRSPRLTRARRLRTPVRAGPRPAAHRQSTQRRP